MDRQSLGNLHRLLNKRFNESELRDLCFELGVDYDSLPDTGKAGKARELVAHLERRDRISELIITGERLRPDIAWSEALFDAAPDATWITTREAISVTGYGPYHLRRLAKRRWIKARKEGDKWLFDRDFVWAHSRGWIGTNEASALTDYSPEYLRWLAREEIVHGRKIRGVWLLQQEDLLDYCRSRGRM